MRTNGILIQLVFILNLLIMIVVGCSVDNSPEAPTTMDTLSHDYLWKRDTLGARNSSVSGMAVFEDEEVWVTGEFYVPDSTGRIKSGNACNLARWNGKNWCYERILFKYKGTDILDISSPLFATGRSHIWHGTTHFDGTTWTGHDVNAIARLGGVNDIWGYPSGVTFFIGHNGSIIRYRNQSFEQIGLSTSAKNFAIHGDGDNVRVAVRDDGVESGALGYFIRIGNDELKVENVPSGGMMAIWGVGDTWYGGGSSPLYKYAQGEWRPVLNVDGKSVLSIAGTDANDVYIALSGGEVIHYNGSTFKVIKEVSAGEYLFVARSRAINDRYYLAGRINGYAVIFRGIRLK